MSPPAAQPSNAVLITGCSSGIGRATAARLNENGWRVYATARRLDSLAELAGAGCETLALDVTDDASMRAAVSAVEAAEGAVGILVNNAGYSLSGAVESIPTDAARQQFETNVFGLVRLIQLALPAMRRQGSGKIVNVGSMGGRLTFPGGGFYHASKHAIEAISDAMRFELRGFGIDVVLIQPGLIKTGFDEAAVSHIPEEAGTDGTYGAFNAAVARATLEAFHTGPIAKLGGNPQAVARVIEKAIKARKPRARYRVTSSARLMLTLRAVLTDRQWDRLMGTSFPRP